MKAIVCTKFGPPEVLQLKEVEKPCPKSNEVLVKVYATSVNYGDLLARNFEEITPGKFNMFFLFWILAKFYLGFNKPKVTIFGSEFSGVIESTGKDVTSFKQGDKVFGYLGQSMGANAEYFCMPENGCISTKPANMTFEEAAVIPYGSVMAINLLRRMNIQPGQKVLINGASGGIGSAAVQLAKHFGAEVTGVCGTPRLEFVKSLGADKIIDYTKTDFTKNGEIYDIIFDVLGKSTFSMCKNSLSSNGRYFLASFKLKQLFQMFLTSITSRKKLICAIAPGNVEDLISVKKLIEAGAIKSIIDRTFPFVHIAEAHQYIEEGHAQGKISISFQQLQAKDI